MWQEAGVVLIVGSALYYLVRKFFGRGPRPKARPSFVPLSALKRRK